MIAVLRSIVCGAGMMVVHLSAYGQILMLLPIRGYANLAQKRV